jgi:membrane-bound lytic murein transglycosylase D
MILRSHRSFTYLAFVAALFAGAFQARSNPAAADNPDSALPVVADGGADGEASGSGEPTAPDAGGFSFSAATNDSSGVHSPEGDERLRQAQAHFNAGRQMYFNGDLAGARKEFDLAVNALFNAPESLPDRRRIERRLDELCDLIYRFDIEKLGAGQTEQDAVVFDKAPIDEISHMTFPVDENLAPKLKTELNQTASGIPLELSDPVLSYVHYFSTDRGRSILLAGLRRSGRYKELIQRVLAEEGVPQELMYLAQAESGFLPRAVSNKRAVGMWQFIAGTGATYGLDRTSSFDERFDPEKATRAAARHLKDLYTRYGDWYLAMAAYDCGAGAVDRAVERTGYADYWELLKRHALPKETASYVPIIVAMTIMAKNPQDYGLQDVEIDPPVEYDSISLTASTNLNLIADATMQPISVIRDLNPSLLRMVAPIGFEIHVPKGAAETTRAALDTVPAQSRQAWRLHHVEAGDTLETIAKAYHLPAGRIAAVNNASDSLEAGDVLLIPAVYHEEKRPVRTRRRASHTARSGNVKTSKTSVAHRSTHVTASRHVSSQVLHRKAAVRTASIGK